MGARTLSILSTVLFLGGPFGCMGDTEVMNRPKDEAPVLDGAKHMIAQDQGSGGDTSIGVDSGGEPASGALKLSYTPVEGCRIVDTRKKGAAFAKDEQRGYLVYGSDMSDQGGNAEGCPLPAGISTPLAAHINVIALTETGGGNFSVFRHGSTAAKSGLVHFNPATGQPYISNAVTIELCPSDDSSCTKHIGALLNYAAKAGLAIDVLGYYTEDTVPDGDADKALVYTPVKPCRAVDTRSGGGGKFSAGQTREYFVYGDASAISGQGGNAAGCPSPRGEPSAVHMRLITVIQDSGSAGYVVVQPQNGSATAVQSFVNYKYGYQHTGNTGTIKTHHGGGAEGKDIKIINKGGSAHMIVDILGYYYPNDSNISKPEMDYLFTPVTPCRLVDTRETKDPFEPKEAQEYLVYGDDLSSQGGDAAGCPSPRGEPRAAHLRFTAVPSDGQGNFLAFAADLTGDLPGSSVINYKSGAQNISNAATIMTRYDSTTGIRDIKVINNNGKEVDLTIVVFGYYYQK